MMHRWSVALRRHRIDLAFAAMLALAAGIASFAASESLDRAFLHPAAEDAWFQSDMPRVYANMTSRGSDHYRASVHPLFALAALPAVGAFWKVLGFDALTSVRLVLAVVAALSIAAFFAIVRLAGLARLDSVLFSLLCSVSAAAVFWFSVPETYGFGALSILLALAVVAAAQHMPVNERWYIGASIGTFGFTITNWMAGIAVAASGLDWKRAARVTIYAFAIATALWIVQQHFMPTLGRFLDAESVHNHVLAPEAGGVLVVLRSFLIHSVVMPAIAVVDRINPPGMQIMSVQHVAAWAGFGLGTTAAAIWAALLGLGVWGFVATRAHTRLRIAIAAVLAGQLLLHLLYGEETFLYSLHFAPLLILVVAFAATTRLRPFVLGLTVALIVSAGVNNYARLADANLLFQADAVKGRADVLRAMVVRPADPWPRGTGHVVLAESGSAEDAKSYHEPGGGFSPAPGSFGVSVWVLNQPGGLVTSDDIPLGALTQRLEADEAGDEPAIFTDTEYYRARWSTEGSRERRLELVRKQSQAGDLAIAIRGVGPAGGPINRLSWNGAALRINDRWLVTVEPAPESVALGSENEGGWITTAPADRQWQDATGWGFARFSLGRHDRWRLRISDARPVVESPAEQFHKVRNSLDVSLPDPRFEASLEAQRAHLLMSLVGNQTRSADPVNTPVPWQRTGAYIVAALARSGESAVAKQLARYLAENDFYGGFGAEADAPGLAIWSLRQVSALADDAQFDRWLWPHVRRKAEVIMEMLKATEPIFREPTGPIVPRFVRHPDNNLVAEAARDGLIVGRMDYHRPLLYVNAVSYRGLLDAAWFARRVGEADAARWSERARKLQNDWAHAFGAPALENDRTYISALWPTWVGTTRRDEISANLRRRWGEKRDRNDRYLQTPLWTYFELAEAHQWLYLGSPDRVWGTLNWFWANQASPGLYTWWEDDTEGNSYLGWNRYRGWVAPKHVTPHYWSTAEMLLLQLEMLAHVAEGGPEQVLVLGAGIPSAWTHSALEVKDVGTTLGKVSWTWRNGEMSAVVRGRAAKPARIRLGSAFPRAAKVRVQYLP
jgi:hypothetical protein